MEQCKVRLKQLGYDTEINPQEKIKIFKDHYNALLAWYNFRVTADKKMFIPDNINGSCTEETLDMIKFAESVHKAGFFTVEDSTESMDTLYGGWPLVAGQAVAWRWLYGSPEYKDIRPDCNIDELLISNQLYQDAKGKFFFVTPDKKKILVSEEKPLELGFQYNHVNGEMLLETVGWWGARDMASYGLSYLKFPISTFLGKAFLPVFAFWAASKVFTYYFGSMTLIPTKARIEIKGGGVPYLIVNAWAGMGSDREEKIEYISCKGSAENIT
jgi:hypothetical protein